MSLKEKRETKDRGFIYAPLRVPPLLLQLLQYKININSPSISVYSILERSKAQTCRVPPKYYQEFSPKIKRMSRGFPKKTARAFGSWYGLDMKTPVSHRGVPVDFRALSKNAQRTIRGAVASQSRHDGLTALSRSINEMESP